MGSAERQGAPAELDPNNGFPIVWRIPERFRSRYTLVKVPNNTPVVMAYQKEALGIDINLAPTESQLIWKVTGIADPDTLQNLMLRMQRRRRADKPPVVGERGLLHAAKFGYLAELVHDDPLFAINLQVPVNNIYYFIRKVWQPFKNEFEYDSISPQYHLGSPERDYRILPQKNELHKKPEYAHLIVKRINTPPVSE